MLKVSPVVIMENGKMQQKIGKFYFVGVFFVCLFVLFIEMECSWKQELCEVSE